MANILFQDGHYSLGTLMNYIEMGEIGLPDIQRPFVWKDTSVRDLFDSMYQGFPIGYLLLWQAVQTKGTRQIGADAKQKTARLLIVDGQQRLTSLFAVIKGIAVVREDYREKQIEIAFNPLTEKFEVADAAIRRDKNFITNISVIWDPSTDIFELVDTYIQNNSASNLLPGDIRKLKRSISTLEGLINYSFTALELSSQTSPEQVSEVFVRINSKGKNLEQADFILTLMSVFWDEGRSQLEDFCRQAKNPDTSKPSPYNHIIEPSPDQLLRVSVGLGFKRARLQYVYSILRGKDLETEEFSEERRKEQFAVLRAAQEKVLSLTHWHDFLKAVRLSGYKSASYISSGTNLMFAYTMYLIGRTEYRVEEFKLRQVIARWFFMSSLTGRFTGSPESAMEFDLARLRGVRSEEEFVAALEAVCNEVFSDDYWSLTLPNDLATSSSRSPSQFAYYASLVLLDAQVLFSNQKVPELIEASTRSTRAALERHHLFPKDYLKKQGVIQLRETNQLANFTFVEWNDNALISNTNPQEYVPPMVARFSPQQLSKMYYWHALPDNWESMAYAEFLMRRRERMAMIIRDAYLTLEKGALKAETKARTVRELLEEGESGSVEFKSTLRMNLHTCQSDAKMEQSVLKTLAGFLNGKGGTLIIGVADDGTPLGLEADNFANEDTFHLHFVNLMNDRLGPQWMMYIHPRFEEYENKRVFAVECIAAKIPFYVKDGINERFYVRAGNSTSEIQGTQAQEYMRLRFRS